MRASIKNYDTVASGALSLKFKLYTPTPSLFRIELPSVAADQTAKVNVLFQHSDTDEIKGSVHHRFVPSLSSISRIDSFVMLEDDIFKGSVTFPAVGDGGLSGTLTSIDFLTDTDKDGVSDYNERLMDTKPDDPDDKPGTVTLDIMALYPAGLEPPYDRESPMECIIHSVEWANMALKNSGIDARYRLVKTKMIEGELDASDTANLVSMVRQEGPFVGIDTKRAAAGADLLVLFMEGLGRRFNQGGGVGTLPPLDDIEADPDSYRRHIVSVARCGPSALLAHELGHNLGLTHSARQVGAQDGVFRLSRGHGEDGDFVTIMGYPVFYSLPRKEALWLQFYSSPKVELCGSSKSRPCGVKGDRLLAANAARSISAMMYRAAQWASDPPDSDGDGTVDSLDVFPSDSSEWRDSDGDMIGDNADTDDDNDGLTDDEEADLGTNPRKVDSDRDGVNDSLDIAPTNENRSIDADNDGVDAVLDANDNDASVRWTRTNVTLTPDATVRANLIATFDDTTEGPAAIRANVSKYTVTGVFTDADRGWNTLSNLDQARVGAGNVHTGYMWDGRASSLSGPQDTGSIKIKGVTITGDYISFLMTGGDGTDGTVDVGVRIMSTGSSALLAEWGPDACMDIDNDHYLTGDRHWRHFDVRALVDQSVDIEIFDNSTNTCGSVAFDHFYQSDYARGELVGTAIASPDMDGDGLSDAQEATLGTNPNLPDTDGDNVSDSLDAFPINAAETTDTDGDRIGNNADLDDDNDGTPDTADAFPLDPNETTDTDGDRIGDNADLDDDNDGIGDARDVEPHNVAVAYEPDRGQVLLPDGMDARNVIADFDDLAEIRAKTTKYELTGVFAKPNLTHWNRFEEEERVAAAAVNN